ncbi:mechanosensitive ion channel [Candidatus Micrarchaeota archaeon]|nr:mechanosensitive ion channel [Candidatus Micrarchaeota archaeon]
MAFIFGLSTDDPVTAFIFAAAVLIFGYFFAWLLSNAFIGLAEKIGLRQKLRFGIQKEAKKFGFDLDIIYLGGLTLKYIVYLISVFVAFRLLPFDVGTNALLGPILSYVPNILSALLILIFGSALIELFGDVVKYKLRDLLDEDAGEMGLPNFSTTAATYVRYFLYTAILLTVFLQLGIRADSLMFLMLGVGGIVLVTLSVLFIISSKDYVSNISGGMYLKNNKILSPGDFLEISGIYGEVEKLTLISTILIKDGKRFYIPNSRITKEIFSIKRKSV